MKREEYQFSDEEYGRVLDNFVIACVDVVVLHGNKVLLEKRTYDPLHDQWWIFGGRIKKRRKPVRLRSSWFSTGIRFRHYRPITL